jgi:hypothetical protein
MDEKNIIQQGERAKFIVTSQREDFDFGVNDYHLEIIYGMMGSKITIEKTDFREIDGQWVFSFPTDEIIGKVKARLVMEIDDRQEVDEQYIGVVISTPCPQFFRCPKCESVGHDVTYDRTEESDIANKYAMLCDCNCVPIMTADDEYICVLRTIINN